MRWYNQHTDTQSSTLLMESLRTQFDIDLSFWQAYRHPTTKEGLSSHEPLLVLADSLNPALDLQHLGSLFRLTGSLPLEAIHRKLVE